MHIQSDAEEIPGASHTQSKGGRWLCVHTVPEGVEFCHILLHVFFCLEIILMSRIGVYRGENCRHYTRIHCASADSEKSIIARVFVL